MTGDTVGGVWNFVLELAENLSAHGTEVILATMGGEPSVSQRKEAEAIPGVRFFASSHRLEWMADPWQDVEASGRWLANLEVQFAPDVIHLNTYGHGAVPFHAPVVLTAHSCVFSWWRAVKRTAPPPEWNRYREEVEKSLQAADWITAPSRAMLRALADHYGPVASPARVIANGRSAARFRPTPKEEFILTAGRLWDEAKNLRALAQVASSLPWPVFAAGDQDHPDGRAVSAGGCRLLGRLTPPEMREWYGRAAIYVHPARYEPFGLSVLEAALSGCALVLGDIESLRELWQDAALFVPPENPARLAWAVRTLIAEPQLRAGLAIRSLQRAQTFTAEKMARGYLDAYSAVMARNQAACAS
jgi:glycosyltransferase involved in cell wall biosynthesis